MKVDRGTFSYLSPQSQVDILVYLEFPSLLFTCPHQTSTAEKTDQNAVAFNAERRSVTWPSTQSIGTHFLESTRH